MNCAPHQWTTAHSTKDYGLADCRLHERGVLAGTALHCQPVMCPANAPLGTGRTNQRCRGLPRDRGCTRPGCTVCGYDRQVHHAVADWKNDGRPNIDDLTFGCSPSAAGPTTAWSRRPHGVPAGTPTVMPSGYRRPHSTPAGDRSTATTTLSDTSCPKTATSLDATRSFGRGRAPRLSASPIDSGWVRGT